MKPATVTLVVVIMAILLAFLIVYTSTKLSPPSSPTVQNVERYEFPEDDVVCYVYVPKGSIHCLPVGYFQDKIGGPPQEER